MHGVAQMLRGGTRIPYARATAMVCYIYHQRNSSQQKSRLTMLSIYTNIAVPAELSYAWVYILITIRGNKCPENCRFLSQGSACFYSARKTRVRNNRHK